MLTSLQYTVSIRNFHKIWNACYRIRLHPKVIYLLFDNNFLTDYVLFSKNILQTRESRLCYRHFRLVYVQQKFHTFVA